MPLRLLALAALTSCALAVPATPVTAQEPPSLPGPGSTALGFDVPWGGAGGNGLAFRRMVAPGRAMGLGLSWNASSVERSGLDQRSGWSVGVRPDVRLYRAGPARVVPFLEVAVGASLRRDSGSEDEPWTVAPSLAVGAEWLVLDRVTLSGTTGVQASWGTDGGDPRATFRSVGLFRSALTLLLYF